MGVSRVCSFSDVNVESLLASHHISGAYPCRFQKRTLPTYSEKRSAKFGTIEPHSVSPGNDEYTASTLIEHSPCPKRSSAPETDAEIPQQDSQTCLLTKSKTVADTFSRPPARPRSTELAQTCPTVTTRGSRWP